MKKQLFLYTTLIISMGFICLFGMSAYTIYNNNNKLAKDTVKETARICAGLYTNNTDPSSFVQAGSNTRITVVSPDGTVLADSHHLDIGALGNHLDRPEIQAAAKGSPAVYSRFSETLGINAIYYALKVNSGDSYVFIRVALPVAKVDAYLFQYLPLLVFLLMIVAGICFYLSHRIIVRITKPFEAVEQRLRLLSSGEYTSGAISKSYDEIDKIIREIDEIGLILQGSFAALREEKNKVEYILDNIGDGLFVVNEFKRIVLINSVALDIFHATPSIVNKHLSYLTYDKSLTEAVSDCIKNANTAMFEFSHNGRVFFSAAKRLLDTNLNLVVLSDVTESRENAKRREEFFANASHELKTPLTAIKGFNELTAINNKDETIQKYIDSITRETDRMLALIGDMLKLSELESTKDSNPIQISLAKIVTEAQETISSEISEKSIIFSSIGDGVVMAEPEHVYELVKNIIENAVRYNRQGGTVTVSIESGRKNVRLSVSDNGIGIPPGDQTRIFERFYRVEKSRSQRSGGTGLGLAIVKHICARYNWKLSLKSKLGVGTEITVVFGS